MTQLNLKPVIKRTREFSDATFTRKLSEAMGSSAAAADLIGVASSTISTGIRDNKISTPTETAAKYWWEKNHAPKAARLSDNLIICQVPENKQESLADFVGHLGGRTWKVDG